jgi:DNA-binding beta-propeller fold protein YncE
MFYQPTILLRVWILLAVAASVCSLFCPTVWAQVAGAQGNEVTARYEYLPHPTLQGVGDLTLELRDALTQQPLDYTGKRLAAWLQKSPKTLSDGELACSDKVRALASQGIGRRAVVDFNTYSLVTVNTDRTVAFINPFLRMNNAKLEGVVTLPGDATALLHHPQARELWIAMRQSDAIAVIDTDTRTIKRTLAFAPGAGPQALALSGRSVWVSFAGRNQWLRFDNGDSGLPSASVAAVDSAQLITSPSTNVVVGLGADGITLLDGVTNEVRTVKLSGTPSAATWSVLAQRWLVATSSKRLYFVDAQRAMVTRELVLDGEAARLIAFDEGRFAVAAVPSRDTVSIVDMASANILQTVPVTAQANELALSASFIYVHSAALGQATLLSLSDSRHGKVQPVNISIGTAGKHADVDQVSTGLTANTPDNLGMLIASPRDAQVYQYAEGMMAPIGSFSNYKRSAVGLVLLNNGFESLGAGRYRTTLRHTQGGPHELVLSGVQPRFASCNALALPEVRDAKREALAAQPQASLLKVVNTANGNAIAVDVRLEEKTSKTPLGAVHDLVLLAFDKRSGWQRRVAMVEQSPGFYSAVLPIVGAATRFDLLVSSATQDMPFGAGFIGTYEVLKP